MSTAPEPSGPPEANLLFRPGCLRALLGEAGFVPQKSRGQNFLIDRNLGEAIVSAAEPGPGDAVLEIGPGPGALTRELCRRALRVLAVERDPVLARILRDQTRDLANLEIVEGDFLALKLAELARRLRAPSPPPARLLAVANLPYSVSGPILARLLESGAGFSRLVLTVQREVGERIVSPPGGKRYGRLSILAALYSRPEIVAAVGRNAFWPRPRVDSVAVRFEILPEPELPPGGREAVSRVVRTAFGKRRKMLKNALAGPGGLGYSEKRVLEACAAAGIDPRRRPEDLAAGEFLLLAAALPVPENGDDGEEDNVR